MGEKSKKIGDKLEGFGENLYQFFGWEELTRDREIKCIKSNHRTEKDRQKQTHGIDLYHKCYDPYKNQSLSIITECKNYQWSSITEQNIQKWFEQLEQTIECAQISEELLEYKNQCDVWHNGILLIHANDGEYDRKTFNDRLRSIRYKSKKNPTNIFIASNYDIDRWIGMYRLIEHKLGRDAEFNFYYPSIMESKLYKSPQISLTQLFSKYIFAEVKEKRQIIQGDTTISKMFIKHVIFSFDKVSEYGFEYLCSMFRELQLENADEYVFCFYPEQVEDIELINEKFIRYASLHLNAKDKVHIELINNSKISPVNNGICI